MDAVAGSFWGLLWLQLSQAKALALASHLYLLPLPICQPVWVLTKSVKLSFSIKKPLSLGLLACFAS